MRGDCDALHPSVEGRSDRHALEGVDGNTAPVQHDRPLTEMCNIMLHPCIDCMPRGWRGRHDHDHAPAVLMGDDTGQNAYFSIAGMQRRSASLSVTIFYVATHQTVC
jgi:hypothetical protein